MEQSGLIVFLAVFALSIFTLRKIISRGKARSIDLLKSIVPMVIIAGGLLLLMQKSDLNVAPYILIGLVIYTSIYWFIMIFKKRDSGLRYFLWLGVVIPYVIAPYFDGLISRLLLLLGGIMSIVVLVYLYKHPYFSAEWLKGAVEEINPQVSRGKYSSKPITVYQPAEKRFIASCSGLRIVAKKDRFILKMSKKLHEKLDYPNLKEFGDLLSVKIIEKQGNTDIK